MIKRIKFFFYLIWTKISITFFLVRIYNKTSKINLLILFLGPTWEAGKKTMPYLLLVLSLFIYLFSKLFSKI